MFVHVRIVAFLLASMTSVAPYASADSEAHVLEPLEVSVSAILRNGKATFQIPVHFLESVDEPYNVTGVAVSCGCTSAKCSSNLYGDGNPFSLEVTVSRKDNGVGRYGLEMHLNRTGQSYILPIHVTLTCQYPFVSVPEVLNFKEIAGQRGSRFSGEFTILQQDGPKWKKLEFSSAYFDFEISETSKAENGIQKRTVDDSANAISRWQIRFATKEQIASFQIPVVHNVAIRVVVSDTEFHEYSKPLGFSRARGFTFSPRLVKIEKSSDAIHLAIEKTSESENSLNLEDLEIVDCDGNLVNFKVKNFSRSGVQIDFTDCKKGPADGGLLRRYRIRDRLNIWPEQELLVVVFSR